MTQSGIEELLFFVQPINARICVFRSKKGCITGIDFHPFSPLRGECLAECCWRV